jgi:hypothetical protein
MLLFLVLWHAALMVLIEWFVSCLVGIAAWIRAPGAMIDPNAAI